MVFRQVIKIISLLFGLQWNPGYALAVDRLELLVGETKPLAIGELASWQLSRRGVVELIQDQNGVWMVLGLRAGVVMARANDNAGRPSKQYLIEVKREQNLPGKPGLLAREPWSSWVCNLPSLNCDTASQRLGGTVDSSEIFYQVYDLCRKYQPCLFALQLSELAKSDLTNRLSLHEGMNLRQILTDGHVHVSLDCERWDKNSWEDFLRSYGFPPSLWHRSCMTRSSSLRMQIEALMVDQKLIMTMQNQALLDYINASSLIRDQHSFQKDRSFHRMLGQPWLELSIGQPIEIHHGMELPVLSSSDSPQEYWRRLGFVLKARVLQRSEDLVQVQLDFSLSQPTRDRVLLSSALQTTIWLPLGVQRLVGVLDSSTHLNQEGQHLLFASIPIIGPLFRSRGESIGQAQVLLFLELQDSGI